MYELTKFYQVENRKGEPMDSVAQVSDLKIGEKVKVISFMHEPILVVHYVNQITGMVSLYDEEIGPSSLHRVHFKELRRITKEKSSDMILSSDATDRKNMPIATGVLDYFPLAIAAVAQASKQGQEQHNPGQPLAWDRTKSKDHADCICRHLIDRGKFDTDGVRHSTKLAWRALAMLQLELEAEKDRQ